MSNIGALAITYTILGVPYCNYSIMGPQNLILIMKAPRPWNPCRSSFVTLIGPFKGNPILSIMAPILGAFVGGGPVNPESPEAQRR